MRWDSMSKQQLPEVPVRFFRTAAGREPVLDWLRGLDREDRRTIGVDLMRVQFGWPIGMPLVRSLKNGLWEVRSNLASQRTAAATLLSPGETGRAPRMYKEDPKDGSR